MKAMIALIQVLIFSCAMATEPSPAQKEMGKWWKNSEMVRTLQLSESQINQIDQIFLHHRPALAALYAELQKRENDLKMLMKADPVDDSRVLSQTELVAASRAALEKANSAMMLEIRKGLSKEQWEKLQQVKDLRESGLAAERFPLVEGQGGPESGEKFYRIGDKGIVPPKVLYQPLPSYTPQAKEAKVEGIILLQGVIRKNGRIENLKVLRELGYGLDESALDTVRKEWRFEPGTFRGEPVDVQANIEISFRLY